MSDDAPDILDVFRAADLLSEPIGPWPAIVESYDPTTGKATVSPTPRVRDRTSGQAYDLGPLDVPVAWWGSGSVVIDVDALVPGDEVLVIPCGPKITHWLLQGGVVDGAGPGKRLGEAVAIPVRLSGPRKPEQASVRLRLGDEAGAGAVRINVTAGGEVLIQGASVKLGAEASPKLPVARDTDPVNQSAAFTTWASQVATFINGLAPGTVSPPAVVDPIGNVAATSVEVESS